MQTLNLTLRPQFLQFANNYTKSYDRAAKPITYPESGACDTNVFQCRCFNMSHMHCSKRTGSGRIPCPYYLRPKNCCVVSNSMVPSIYPGTLSSIPRMIKEHIVNFPNFTCKTPSSIAMTINTTAIWLDGLYGTKRQQVLKVNQ